MPKSKGRMLYVIGRANVNALVTKEFLVYNGVILCSIILAQLEKLNDKFIKSFCILCPFSPFYKTRS